MSGKGCPHKFLRRQIFGKPNNSIIVCVPSHFLSLECLCACFTGSLSCINVLRGAGLHNRKQQRTTSR